MSDEDMIEDHKQMIILSGKISNFQLNNLTKYPFILLENLDKITIDYNFNRTGTAIDGEQKMENTYAGEIVYNFIFKKEPEYLKEDLLNRLNQLENWVKHLFWTNTVVKFKKDNKIWVI